MRRKKADTIFFGIDLGTRNSSIAYVPNDPRLRSQRVIDPQVVKIPGADDQRNVRLPSCVILEDTAKRGSLLRIGWDMVAALRDRRNGTAVPLRGVDYFRSVKSDIGSGRVYTRARTPECGTPSAVTGLVLARLLHYAEKATGIDPRGHPVIITVPASFSVLARQDTIEAAVSAGLREEDIDLIDEPIAALLDFVSSPDAAFTLETEAFKNILVFDYGGGTCDVALVRARFDRDARTGLHAEHLAISEYRQLGGDDVDRAVMKDVVWPQLHPHHETLAPGTRYAIEEILTFTAARELKERMCRKVSDLLDENGNEAWNDLAGRPDKVDASVGWLLRSQDLGRRPPQRVEMTSRQFETLMERFVGEEGESSLLGPILETLEKGGCSSLDLDALVLHGGGCRNPYVQRLLDTSFGTDGSLFRRATLRQTPDLDASVARGAALACYWKHGRGEEIIRPILGSDLGIIAAGDSPVLLVESGTALPYPDDESVQLAEASFYVPHDAQRELLVPYYSRSHERLAGSMSIRLPPSVRQGAPVRVKLSIDRNKLLRWWFSVDGGAFLQAPDVNDPWTQELHTADYQRVVEYRRKLREVLEHTGAVPADMERDELELLFRAQAYAETARRLEELFAAGVRSARLLNLKSLLASRAGRTEEALEAAKQAVELEKTNAVFRGNLGYLLADLGRYAEAEPALRQALVLDPDLLYVYERLGDLYRDKSDEPSAVAHYTRAEALAVAWARAHPERADAWYRCAALHTKLGRYDLADEAMLRARKAHRDNLYQGDSDQMMGRLCREDD